MCLCLFIRIVVYFYPRAGIFTLIGQFIPYLTVLITVACKFNRFDKQKDNYNIRDEMNINLTISSLFFLLFLIINIIIFLIEYDITVNLIIFEFNLSRTIDINDSNSKFHNSSYFYIIYTIYVSIYSLSIISHYLIITAWVLSKQTQFDKYCNIIFKKTGKHEFLDPKTLPLISNQSSQHSTLARASRQRSILSALKRATTLSHSDLLNVNGHSTNRSTKTNNSGNQSERESSNGDGISDGGGAVVVAGDGSTIATVGGLTGTRISLQNILGNRGNSNNNNNTNNNNSNNSNNNNSAVKPSGTLSHLRAGDRFSPTQLVSTRSLSRPRSVSESHTLSFTMSNLHVPQHPPHTRSMSNSNGNRFLPLRTVLANEQGFQLFADFCVREFSVESLLFLYHLSQIKYLLLEHELSVVFFLFCFLFLLAVLKRVVTDQLFVLLELFLGNLFFLFADFFRFFFTEQTQNKTNIT